MAITRLKKENILKKIGDGLKDSNNITFVSFSNITANDMNSLRNKLRAEGVTLSVLKKTLLAKALKDLSLKGEEVSLDGEIFVSYGKDSIAPARLIKEIAKKDGLNLSIQGGVYEGSIVGMEKMNTIASIPSREVLLAKFAFVIRAPLYKLVSGISEKAKQNN